MHEGAVLIRAVITFGLLAIAGDAVAQAPEEIRLWPGKAPGSENWTRPEVITTSPSGDRTISNVSDPAVTVFLPSQANATGTAVVIAPGGALRVLGWDNEGVTGDRQQPNRDHRADQHGSFVHAGIFP